MTFALSSKVEGKRAFQVERRACVDALRQEGAGAFRGGAIGGEGSDAGKGEGAPCEATQAFIPRAVI